MTLFEYFLEILSEITKSKLSSRMILYNSDDA